MRTTFMPAPEVPDPVRLRSTRRSGPVAGQLYPPPSVGTRPFNRARRPADRSRAVSVADTRGRLGCPIWNRRLLDAIAETLEAYFPDVLFIAEVSSTFQPLPV